MKSIKEQVLKELGMDNMYFCRICLKGKSIKSTKHPICCKTFMDKVYDLKMNTSEFETAIDRTIRKTKEQILKDILSKKDVSQQEALIRAKIFKQLKGK